LPSDTGASDLIAAVIGEIATTGGMPNLLGHSPHQGLRRHREAVADWLASLGVNADAEQVFITHGSRHALSLALDTITEPGDTVLTENLTSAGMLALSVQKSYRLQSVTSDAEGLLPGSLDLAFSETGARIVYCMPTLQVPTGATMSPARRRAIAAVIRKHDAYLVEDDTYAYLMVPPLPPISALVPERSLYVTNFAKCLAPGLWVAAMIAPDSLLDRTLSAAQKTGSIAVPLMAEVVARLIINGSMARQVRLKRGKAASRNATARRVLRDWLPHGPATGFHIWLPLPATCALDALVTQAAQAGITLTPSVSPHDNKTEDSGIRLCLGAPKTEEDLERALLEIRRILEMAETISFI
jgi:DNA-binding transcriptional MocR family regulator